MERVTDQIPRTPNNNHTWVLLKILAYKHHIGGVTPTIYCPINSTRSLTVDPFRKSTFEMRTPWRNFIPDILSVKIKHCVISAFLKKKIHTPIFMIKKCHCFSPLSLSFVLIVVYAAPQYIVLWPKTFFKRMSQIVFLNTRTRMSIEANAFHPYIVEET